MLFARHCSLNLKLKWTECEQVKPGVEGSGTYLCDITAACSGVFLLLSGAACYLTCWLNFIFFMLEQFFLDLSTKSNFVM